MTRAIPIFLFLFCLSVSSVFSQPVSAGLKTFDKEGIRFDYPADWTLVDAGTASSRHLQLSKENTSLLIDIVSPHANVSILEQFLSFKDSVDKKYLGLIESGFAKNHPVKKETACLDFQGENVPGTLIQGIFNSKTVVGEVYPFGWGDNAIGLTYSSDRGREVRR